MRVLHPFFILDIWNDAYKFLRKHLSLIESWVLVIYARSSSARDRRVASSSCIDDRYHNSPRAIFGSIEVLAGRKIYTKHYLVEIHMNDPKARRIRSHHIQTYIYIKIHRIPSSIPKKDLWLERRKD